MQTPIRPLRSPLRAAISECRRHFTAIGVFSALLNLLYLAPTLYMLQVYGRALTSRGMATLAFLTLIFVMATTTLSALDLVRSRLLVRASVRLDRLISPRILAALIARRQAPANSQALRDFDALRNTLTGPGLLAMFDAPWTPIYVLVCFLIHPLLGAFALLGSAVLVTIAFFNERAVKAPLREANTIGSMAYASIDHSATVGGIARAMGMGRALVRKHLFERQNSTAAAARAALASGGFYTLTKFARLTMQSLALGLGVFLAIQQKVSPGEIFAASLLVTRALAPIEQLVGAWKSLAQARTAWDGVNRLLADADDAGPRTLLPTPSGRMAVESVSVLSPARDRAIVSDVSFELRPGEVLGIIGPSGAGKSTLVRAIAGAAPSGRGAVRFDGASREDWNEEQLARHLGYCPQEPTLFAGTIKENIARFSNYLGEDAETLDAAVIRAATACGAHDMIVRLPGAYDTRLGLGGSGLSAGQAQRVALARAFFGEPRVIVMDEPNAHLDARGEQDLLAALLELKRSGVTVVIVAHRDSVIPAIDTLLVLRNGRPEMLGPRDDVLRRMASQPPPGGGGQAPVPLRPAPHSVAPAAAMGT